MRTPLARLLVVAILFATMSVVTPTASASASCNAVPKGDVPVVMVHGFYGEKNVWVKGSHSIYDGIDKLRGVSTPVLFDYHEHNLNWVDDSEIGPKLADTILCLANKATDHKVIAIAHSMGGLAIRYAASKTPQAGKVRKALGLVVTVGTPNTGSYLASLGELLLSACDFSNIPALQLNRPDWCIPAANGLQLDSKKLRELPMLPNEVGVQAIAGDVTFTQEIAPGLKVDVDTHSDLIVGLNSAKQGHNLQLGGGETVASCKTPLIGGNPSCWHGALPSNDRVKSQVVTSIKRYLQELHQPPFVGRPFKFHDLTIGLRPGWQVQGSGSDAMVSVTDNQHCSGDICLRFEMRSPQHLTELQLSWQQIDPPECSVNPRVGGDKHPVAKGSAPIGNRLAQYYEQRLCPPSVKQEKMQFWYLPKSRYLVVNQGVDQLGSVLAAARWN